jgi:hypothetical protein
MVANVMRVGIIRFILRAFDTNQNQTSVLGPAFDLGAGVAGLVQILYGSDGMQI